ncbi:MAG TPA: hypothetical protein PKJ47_02830 [Candidatus Limiplasma sp.]|nr:hypothetical protein [Candidatus Limiplasma sp.]
MLNSLWYFYLYAFVGWCAEVAFAAVKNGRFVNRGFLNGPVCPIYGVGLVAVLWALSPFQHNLLALYLGAVVLTTGIEWATGFFMEKLFHQRWWDYSRMPLNIGGYVCLLFSLVWGVACVFIVEVLHPLVARLVLMLPQPWSVLLLAVFSATLLADVCVTVATVTRLNRRLSQIDDVAAAIRAVSDRLGNTLADGALALKTTDEIACDDLAEAQLRAKNALLAADEKTRAELKARHAELIERLERGQSRILNAFPALRSVQHPAALGEMKARLSRLRERRAKR